MAEVTLPPPDRRTLWITFLKWVLGIPVLVPVALGIIWSALWASGSSGLMPSTESDMGTVLFWLAAIVLLYPAMLFVWVSELRDGLRARRDWDAKSPDEQADAIARQVAAKPAGRKRRPRRKAGAA